MSAPAINARWAAYSDAQQLEAYYVTPEGQPPRGTLLMLQEIFGVNAAMRHLAGSFAAQGYNVIVPDLFSHIERRVDLGYDEASRKKGFGLMQQLDMQRAIADCQAAVAWAARQPGSNGKSAVIGYCIGGQLAVRLAAVTPLDAAISFYGVKLEDHADALRAIRCPLQYHVGSEDAHIPPASVSAVAGVLDQLPNASMFVYPGAAHGFFNALRTDVYAPGAADEARRHALALLKERLA